MSLFGDAVSFVNRNRPDCSVDNHPDEAFVVQTLWSHVQQLELVSVRQDQTLGAINTHCALPVVLPVF
jgi:hypothetical protein